MRDLIWFIWKSWSYLGCDSGVGRWRRRREYFTGLAPAALRFVRLMREDQWNHDQYTTS